MPAYNFQARFAPLVESGQKLTTIRGREAKVGATAYLFTGMRTKQCHRLGQGVITSCRPIALGFQQNGMPRASLGAFKLGQAWLADVASHDGFASARELVQFFAETYNQNKQCGDGGYNVYSGFLITWALDTTGASAS